MTASEAFILFTLAGLVLAVVEAFLPGWIAGTAAAACLLAAAGLAFPAFGFTGGLAAAILLLAGSVGFVVLWIRVLPRTRFGHTLVLEKTMEIPRTDPAQAGLVGKEGTALTRLAPGGKALVDGKRLDVLSDGTWIDAGERVRVVRVQGSAVTVRKAEAA